MRCITQGQWPATTSFRDQPIPSGDGYYPTGMSRWHGSLVEDQKDASGRLFRRNRFYDPATGRFTQEDPIGLAGGLNAYGFGHGDPVNFSDPFGFCTPWPDCMFQAAANWGASRGGALGGAVLNVAAAANAASEAVGINDLGRAVGDGDTRGLAIAAIGFLPVGKLGKAARATPPGCSAACMSPALPIRTGPANRCWR